MRNSLPHLYNWYKTKMRTPIITKQIINKFSRKRDYSNTVSFLLWNLYYLASSFVDVWQRLASGASAGLTVGALDNVLLLFCFLVFPLVDPSDLLRVAENKKIYFHKENINHEFSCMGKNKNSQQDSQKLPGFPLRSV